jgi:hypothetical protein
MVRSAQAEEPPSIPKANKLAVVFIALLFGYYEVYRWIPLGPWNGEFHWPVNNDQFYPDIVIGLLLMAVAQSTPSHLQLLAKVVTSVNPAQTEVAVTFLNTSDHTFSFPKPALFCHELAGSMTVSSRFKPADANSPQNSIAMRRGLTQRGPRQLL